MKHIGLRRGAALALAALLLGVVGCYEKTVDGSQSVYRFAWWLGPTIIGVGLLGIPLGWLLTRRNQTLGIIIMVLMPVLIIMVAPAMYSDRVIVDDQHFETTYGFWFSPTVHNLRFDQLSAIHHVAVEDTRGRIKHQLHCVTRDGATHVVSCGDLVRNTVPEILARARARGVVVTEP